MVAIPLKKLSSFQRPANPAPITAILFPVSGEIDGSDCLCCLHSPICSISGIKPIPIGLTQPTQSTSIFAKALQYEDSIWQLHKEWICLSNSLICSLEITSCDSLLIPLTSKKTWMASMPTALRHVVMFEWVEFHSNS